MAFTPIGTLNGEFSPVNVTFPVSSLTLPQGALVSVYPAATPTLAGLVHTTLTTKPILGVTTGAVASTATSADVTICPNGTRGYIDVLQIMNGTTLTATGGSGTTIVDSSMLTFGIDDTMIGAVLECVTCASGDAKVGQQMVVTDYAYSSGTFTFASVGSTGFASGDTYKLIRLGISSATSNYVAGSYILWLDQTASTGFAAVDLNQTATAAMRWCYVLGTDNTGKKLDVVLTACLNGHQLAAS